uniref:Uncharacterized protein n=1 Tax=Candidatus Kentrum sp. SD TaxID=2126332 RepID=A0A450YYN0_9GAMM|nr:MAG: hypothetical protein BECKSD772F_GA0070984_103712 [Candidatus Kentron sp. SD]VFK46633.1 MAG: hypothetical protein BECKSD772E_GA0070983_107712 [Candidatus Kentron sp. SD]VFK80089.1 MAG: hypothetical protein BECKSD772D_GA0070982_108412 [Candidatus Kentron sp. SD]
MKDERTGNRSGLDSGTDWEKLRAMTDNHIHAAFYRIGWRCHANG